MRMAQLFEAYLSVPLSNRSAGLRKPVDRRNKPQHSEDLGAASTPKQYRNELTATVQPLVEGRPQK